MSRPTTGARYAERYAAAVARAVPSSAREEVRAEVAATIADQVEPRLAAGEAVDDAERAVVEGLGDPMAYAASLVDRPMWLIGPRYYAAWVRLLRLLLLVVTPCVMVGVAIATLLQGGGIGEVIGALVPVVLQSVVQIAFWTTLVFFILERTGSTGETITDWSPDHLPAFETRGVALSDFVATVVMSLLLGGAVVWDRFVGWGSRGVRVLSPDLWPVFTVGFLVILALTVLVSGLVLARGGWSLPLAVANLLLGTVTAVVAVVLVWQHRLLAPDLAALFDGVGTTVGTILDVILTAVFLGVLIGSAVDGFRKLRRAPAA